MKTYRPLPVIPSYTDEALTSDTSLFGEEMRALLLTVPAGYRQAAEAEVYRRTTRLVERSGGFEEQTIGSVSRARAAVVAEIKAQLEREKKA